MIEKKIDVNTMPTGATHRGSDNDCGSKDPDPEGAALDCPCNGLRLSAIDEPENSEARSQEPEAPGYRSSRVILKQIEYIWIEPKANTIF